MFDNTYYIPYFRIETECTYSTESIKDTTAEKRYYILHL